MRCLTAALAALLLAVPAFAADWPRFRGPDGAGVADGSDLPDKFGPDENLRWKADLPGKGISSPVVAGGKVFLTAASGPDQERLHVLCFDAKTGKKLWERQLNATGSTMCHGQTSIAAPTPVVDGDTVYALFASGDLVALDKDGGLKWYRGLVSDYPEVMNGLGLAASPVVAKGTVVVPMDNGGQSFLAGLDPKDGKNRWKVERPKSINWVTPLVAERAGGTEVVAQGPEDLTAYDPATGGVKWTMKPEKSTSIPSPFKAGERMLVFGEGLMALEPQAGTSAPPKEAWKSKLQTYMASAIAYRGRAYTIGKGGVLSFVDLEDGKNADKVRTKEDSYWASPVAADGKLYVTGFKGLVTAIDVTGKEPKVLFTADFKEGMGATPAIAGGAMFLRSDAHLFCVGK